MRGRRRGYAKKNEFSREMESERTLEKTSERDENAQWKLSSPVVGPRLVGTSRTKNSPECSFVQRI